MDKTLKCEYCDYIYQGRASSLLMLHKCSDEEYHYIDRIDLIEEPLAEIETLKPKRSYVYGRTPKI